MGWKNVQTHYQIDHTVHVTDEGICIGSPYVHNLLVIKADGSVVYPHSSIGRGGKLDRYVRDIRADPSRARQLIESPDHFERSITVYTYRMGDIIEKQCEEPGYPNVTHDGEMMYDNTFSQDRDEVVAWAKRNCTAAIENIRDSIAEAEQRLCERRARLPAYEAALAKLCGETAKIEA